MSPNAESVSTSENLVSLYVLSDYTFYLFWEFIHTFYWPRMNKSYYVCSLSSQNLMLSDSELSENCYTSSLYIPLIF